MAPLFTPSPLPYQRVLVVPAARRSVPALMVVLPLMNCGASRRTVPGRALVMPAVPVMADSTVSVWPEATWKIASAPKATTGTARVAPVPALAPLVFTRTAPLLMVSVDGLKPPRPSSVTEPAASLVRAKALMVCAPVRELALL